MKTYSVFYRNDAPLDGKGLVLVPEHFSWLAFMLPIPYAIWRRLWAALIVYCGLVFSVQTGLNMLGAGQFSSFLISVAAGGMFSLAAPLLIAGKLANAGYGERSPVEASSLMQAEKMALEGLQEKNSEINEILDGPETIGPIGTKL